MAGGLKAGMAGIPHFSPTHFPKDEKIRIGRRIEMFEMIVAWNHWWWRKGHRGRFIHRGETMILTSKAVETFKDFPRPFHF
jgi:hypothetical protein